MAVRNPLDWLGTNFNKLLYGPVVPYKPTLHETTDTRTPALHHNTSSVFESHIAEADYSKVGSKSKAGNKAISLSWDENEGRGISPEFRQWEGMSERERKETLLRAYLANPWVSTCVDVIAKRITSGGFAVEPVKQGEGNEANQEKLRQFCLLINDHWDFLQFVRAVIMDILIFGEAYCEIVWQNGVPVKLFKIDCLTMTYQLDPYGNIIGYQQQLLSTTKPNPLDPKNIIRWWFPHPGRSMDALSPIERVLDAVNVDKKMVNWVTSFFQKGAKAPFWIKSGAEENEANRFLAWFRENFTGEKNAHVPLVTWGEGEIKEFGKGAVDIDFGKGRDRNRTEVLAGYNVPPAVAGIIESGNIGGGSGEDQEKSFQYNTCDPVKQMFFEKFNFRIVQQGMKITDYLVTTRYADYRNDEAVAKVHDMNIRNGSITINEVRQERGKLAYKDGGDTAIVVASRDIVPVPRLDAMEDEQTQSAALDNQTKAAQLDKIKNPPAPTTPALIPGMSNQANNVSSQKQQQSQVKDKLDQAEESMRVLRALPVQLPVTNAVIVSPQKLQTTEANANRPAILSQHTGMMVAFLLDQAIAEQLAIPGGEPASDLHVTLAFLGDTADFTGSIDHLKGTIELFARTMEPLSGKVSGIGRFTPPNADVTPVYASVDIPDLQAFRELLVDELHSAGYAVADDFAYTPHITLAYIDANASMPIKNALNVPLTFTQLCLAVGDDRYFFPLGETHEAYNPKTLVWEPDDISQTIAGLQERGIVEVTWDGGVTMCAPICAPNNGKTVKLGETFPSGHRLTPGHPNCGCNLIYKDAAGHVVEVEKK